MKGQGSVMIAILFFSILILSILPLTLYMYNTSMGKIPVYEDPIYKFFHISMKTLSGDLIAFFNTSNLQLLIVNRGGSDIEIERKILHIICGDAGIYITSESSTILKSGQSLNIQMNINRDICSNPKPNMLYIVTKEGVVISSVVISPEDIQNVVNPIANITMPRAITTAVTLIPIKLKPGEDITNISLITQKGFGIYTLNDMNNPTRLIPYGDLKGGMLGGIITARSTWMLNRVYTNSNIEISGRTVRCIWIGYDPRDTTKYNMIITADSISISSPSYSTTSPVRIRIFGFKPSTTQGILQLGSSWIREPSQDVADYTFLTTSSTTTTLTMRGVADRIEIYVRSTSSTETSYNPYILFMNTFKSQGFAGILFTTIDRTWGFYNSRNDGINSLLDYSTKPLVLVYKNFNVSNIDYGAIVITINYRFHDNEGSDAQGTSADRPIMFVGLVDDNDVIYSYRSYTFRELTRYEDTYPPTAQAQSSLVFIPLPPKESSKKTFYVFIAIQDPYSYNDNLDDLDFTLYIESLSIIPIR